MNGLKIYSGPLSMFGAKVEMAAHEKGIRGERRRGGWSIVLTSCSSRMSFAAIHPNLLAWRKRVFNRPAVRLVVTAMADYLRSKGRVVPELGG